ncbi:MAG: transcriptional regulator NrdR, partial [Holophagales bacterium]|nr:transcriptional regulator NrdR [Holophagales bacterium]
MKCPFCAANDDRVVDSRESRDGATIRRRRECLACNRRFTSYEQIEAIPYLVIKVDGRREEFSRQKLLTGLMKACEKRPIPARRQEEIVEHIEQQLHQREEREISTSEIGSIVMDRLRELDPVAYVRFAS